MLQVCKPLNHLVMHTSELCNLFIESCNGSGISFVTFGNNYEKITVQDSDRNSCRCATGVFIKDFFIGAMGEGENTVRY